MKPIGLPELSMKPFVILLSMTLVAAFSPVSLAEESSETETADVSTTEATETDGSEATETASASNDDAAAPEEDATETEETFSVNSILPSLAIIEVETKAGKACGSGFVTEMDGKKYLVTNQHVLDSFLNININTLDNVNITPKSFELCPTLDLVRMEITNDLPALIIGKKAASIGIPIAVYGNSEGGGVATEIKGKILGVGPDLIEVDAEFVQGNSGCPIVDVNGTVMGVASFATLFEDPENWLSKETRFQKVRRYGIRLDTCTWSSVNPRTFSQQSKFISDAETAIMDYVAIIDFFANKDGFKGYVKEGGRMTYSPDASAYYTKTFYKGSDEYYKMACSMLRSYIDAIKGGRNETSTQRILSNLGRESVKHLHGIEDTLNKQRFASKYLKTRADELGQVCNYCINTHW